MTVEQGAVGSRVDARPSPLPDDGISLWEVLAVLLRRRGLVVRAVMAAAFLAAAVTFLRDRTWTTTAQFRSQGSGGVSELASLASQFGVAVGSAEDGESPEFYAELLRSREILTAVADRAYPTDAGDVALVDLLDIEADTEALRLARAVKWLEEKALSVSTGRETGTVTVEVRTRWPQVSRAVADGLLAEIARFNLETRQSQAAAERAFIEERVELAERELRTAEEALQAFLQNNRVIGEFSQAKSEFDRLQREVLLRQQVYTTLVQSHEQARISEVRDTPVLTILQTPFLPPEPDGRRLVLSLALGVVLGGMVGVVLAFVVEAFQRPPSGGDPAREDFQEAWYGLIRSLPFRRQR